MNMDFKDLESFNEYLSGIKKVGEHYYVSDNKKFIKLYSDDYLERYHDVIDEEKLLKYKDLLVDGVVFVEGIIYLNGTIVGEISQYVEGKSGKDKYFGDIPINKLILSLEKLKNTVQEISKNGIVINDPYIENIIFDGNNFVLVDMTEADDCDKNYDDIFKENMINIMYELFEEIFIGRGIDNSSIYGYLEDINSKYKNFLYEDDYLLMNPGRLIKEIVLEIEGILGKKFNTINEIDNYLKRNIFMEDSYYLNRGFKR